jgi:hypothetical protein
MISPTDRSSSSEVRSRNEAGMTGVFGSLELELVLVWLLREPELALMLELEGMLLRLLLQLVESLLRLLL